jgi:hypothetical protein
MDPTAGAPELHTPPIATSVNVVVLKAQSVDEPVIVPALGNGFTVTTAVVYTVLHELVTK